jgi:3-oxoacyl-[acyl-carrier protein] reductase
MRGAGVAETSPAERTVALVTGASGGIGAASCLALARAGFAVAVGYRSDREGAEETVAKARAEGPPAMAVAADVGDEASIDDAFRRVETELGSVRVLVNNAGFIRDGLAIRYSTSNWDATLDTNLKGAFLCSRRAMAAMLKARWGRIVNVASAAALKGNPGQAAYSASKAGLVGMTRSLAREVGGRGITVNAVCPGFVETKMTRGQSDDVRGAVRNPGGGGLRHRLPGRTGGRLRQRGNHLGGRWADRLTG